VCCDRLLDIAGRSCFDDAHKDVLFHTSSRLSGNSTAVTRNSIASGSSQASALPAGALRLSPANSLMPATLSITTESRLQVVSLRPSVSCESFLPVPIHGRLSPLPPLTGRQTSSYGRTSPVTVRQTWAPAAHSDDHISLPGMLTAAGCTGSSLAERVAVAMACTDFPPAALAKVEGYKQNLNTSSLEWKRLSDEADAHILSALMWDWIDELKVSTTSIGCLLSFCLLTVTDSVFHSLVVSLVMPWLDYCNTILAGFPASQLSQLQSVLNAAARLIH